MAIHPLQQRQQDDLELWRKWQSSNSPQDLEPLLNQLEPLIQREVQKWGSVVPPAALSARARLLTVDALKKYNPNKGAAVGTHVASQIRKLSRHVYPYQNVARLPENKQLNYNTFQVAQQRLVDNLGREPSSDELSDELGWNPRKVGEFQKAFGLQEYVESEGAYFDVDQSPDMMVDFYHHGLASKDKVLFEDITGYQGKPSMNNSGLMRKHKMTQGQLSYRKRKFVADINKIKQGGF